MYLTSGYCNLILHSAAMAGYRPQQTACGFSISGFDPGDMGDLYTAWTSFGQDLGLPTNTQFLGVDLIVGTADPEAPIVYNYTAGTTGTGSSATDPPMSCILVTKNTLLGGRKGRGRMFLPAPPSAESFDSGRLNTTYMATVETAVDDWATLSGTVLGGEPYLLHTEATPVPTAITSFTCSSRLAIQSRRQA